MSSVIYTNMASLVAQKNLLGAQNALATSVERLSSGLRINRARDDASGLAVANSLTTQINGAKQGIRNLNDGISMVQTAEGAIAAAADMGQRILTLATQGANATLGSERQFIKDEMIKLIDSIDLIKERTKYSGNALLSGNTGASDTATLYSMQISNAASDKVQLNEKAFADIGSTQSSRSAVTTQAALEGANTLYLTVASTEKQYSRSDIRVQATAGQIAANVNLYDGSRSITGKLYTLSGSTYTLADSTSAASASTLYENNGNGTYTAITKTNIRVVAANTDIITNNTGPVYSSVLYDAENNAIGTVTAVAKGTEAGRAYDLTQSIRNVNLNSSASEITTQFQVVQSAADAYIKSITDQRSLLGAYQNQMEYTLSNITDLSSNLSASKSRVIDTDYAAETAALTRGQILQQAATAMLAQANQMPNVILTLLK